MFSKTFSLLFLTLPFLASAAPAELASRQSIDTSSHCGQWDTVTAGTYELFLDQWGIGSGITGSDCATVTSQSSNSISWTNTWSWSGGTGIKSYTNVQQNSGANRKLSAIGTMNVCLLLALDPSP